MKKITWAISLIAIGAVMVFTVISYGHSNFASKDSVDIIRKDVREIRIHLMGPVE